MFHPFSANTNPKTFLVFLLFSPKRSLSFCPFFQKKVKIFFRFAQRPLLHLHGDKVYQSLICSLASGASNKHRVSTPTISHTIHGTGIFPYIYHKNQTNVGKSIIHGWYGFDYSKTFIWTHVLWNTRNQSG